MKLYEEKHIKNKINIWMKFLGSVSFVTDEDMKQCH